MKCPHCKKDIREAVVLSWAGSIIAKRRKRQGKQITPDEAREMQKKSAAARRAKRTAREDSGHETP